MKAYIFFICFIFVSFIDSISFAGLPTNSSFPRIFGMNIGRPNNYDASGKIRNMSKCDILVLNFWPRWKDYKYGKNSIRSFVAAVKDYNPNVIIGQYTILNESQLKDDVNNDRIQKIEKENWWLRNNRGERLQWTNKYRAWDINITTFARPDNRGMYYPEWLAHRNYSIFFEKVPEFDFWYLDNSLNTPPSPPGNWYLDGVNRPSTDENVAKAYRKGHVLYWTTIRKLQPYTMLIGNSDNLESVEYSCKLNGAFLEAIIGKIWSIETRKGWLAMQKKYYSFMDNTLPPKIVGFNVWGRADDYQKMRYGLASCLMNDGYFSYTDETKGYSEVIWFDEFDVDLGQPIDPPPTAAWRSGVYRRQFEKGLVLVNPTKQKQVVAIELGYRRIKGRQVPALNNGKAVQSLVLPPKDGAILLRHMD